MSYKIEKIDAQIENFNTGTYSKNLTNVFETLKKRSLGEKHFEQAKQQFREMARAATAAGAVVTTNFVDTRDTNPSQPLKDRQLRFFMMYMASEKADRDALVPVSFKVVVDQTMVSLCTREMPVRISSEHLEFRHVQRTAETLKYDSNDFKFAIAFCLSLSMVLRDSVKEGSQPVPCIIPHSHGVFLGSARYETSHFVDTRCAIYKSKIEERVSCIIGDPYIGAPVTIDLKTSLSRRELSEGQNKLHDQLLLSNAPAYDQVWGRGVDIHALGSMHVVITPQEHAEWFGLCRKLGDVVASPLWREESRRAMQNIRKHEYN